MKFDKQKKAELAALVKAAREAEAEVEERLDEALQPYNDALRALADFRDGVVDDLNAEADERSERWRESEAGETHAAMLATWEELELDEVEVEFEPRDLDAVEDAPTNPSEV